MRSLGVKGIGTHEETRRFYPNRSLAAHVLGFTNVDEEGRAGVERAFDEKLRGGVVTVSALRDALGNRIMTGGFAPPSSLNGDGLRLTIDRQVQYVAESVLAETVKAQSARAAVAIVLEVSNGDLLAMAPHPTFNPNNLSGASPNHQLNRAVGAVYEPGSTLKMLTIAAALEEGTHRPEDRIDCEGGSWRIGGRTIRDTHTAPGTLRLDDVLRVSSNVCAAKVGLALGRESSTTGLSRSVLPIRRSSDFQVSWMGSCAPPTLGERSRWPTSPLGKGRGDSAAARARRVRDRPRWNDGGAEAFAVRCPARRNRGARPRERATPRDLGQDRPHAPRHAVQSSDPRDRAARCDLGDPSGGQDGYGAEDRSRDQRVQSRALRGELPRDDSSRSPGAAHPRPRR
ncbi:MAG: hypothetical protein HC923_09325 [Myxococcales bacterium]|nr:hypothetical protein [Myxococcales bacterium]